MSLSGLRLLMSGLGVAIDAGKAGIVGGNLMAIVAGRTMVRDREIGVIEGCAEPGRRCVARVAGGGITSGDVIGNAATKSLRTVPVC